MHCFSTAGSLFEKLWHKQWICGAAGRVFQGVLKSLQMTLLSVNKGPSTQDERCRNSWQAGLFQSQPVDRAMVYRETEIQ